MKKFLTEKSLTFFGAFSLKSSFRYEIGIKVWIFSQPCQPIFRRKKICS
jgi:hypothetical protein